MHITDWEIMPIEEKGGKKGGLFSNANLSFYSFCPVPSFPSNGPQSVVV
jgi:hypothetical protein